MEASITALPAPAGAVARVRRGIRRRGAAGLVREAVTRPLRPALAPLAARRLTRAAHGVDSVDEVMDLAFGFDAFGITIAPGQRPWEFRQLLDEVAWRRPRRILEIGTATGGSLFSFCRLAAPDALVISIDLPDGEFGGGYPSWKTRLYEAFSGPRQQLALIRGDSHDPAALITTRALLGDEPLDFLFIDGDHTYDGVRQDFETFAPLVRPGGLIGFHDVAEPRGDGPPADGNRYLVGEVPCFWAEVRERHGGREWIDPDGGGCFGIGVIEA